MTFRDRLIEAKKVSLISLIEELGYKLDDTGSYHRMLSPLRAESNSSFDIDKRKPNKWIDRGTGKHGDIIDFVRELMHYSTYDAVNFILKKNNIELPRYEPVKRNKKSIEIHLLEDLSNPVLIDYLTKRHISIPIAKLWLKQAAISFPYGKNPDRKHMVLAWGNDSGGHEFRNSFLKVSNSPKNVTTIKQGNHVNVLLFEGWPDFLSYLTLKNIDSPPCDVHVLNSISFLEVMLLFLKKRIVHYLGQRDKAGNEALKRMNERGLNVIDLRWFIGYKDLNDYLCHKKVEQKMSELLNT